MAATDCLHSKGQNEGVAATCYEDKVSAVHWLAVVAEATL